MTTWAASSQKKNRLITIATPFRILGRLVWMLVSMVFRSSMEALDCPIMAWYSARLVDMNATLSDMVTRLLWMVPMLSSALSRLADISTNWSGRPSRFDARSPSDSASEVSGS